MTNKIKLLLWSFLTILFVWLSSTYALELNWLRSIDKTCLANKNGQNLIDRGWNYGDKYYFTCIEGREAQSELDKYWRKIQVEQFESKTYKLIYSQDSYIRPFKYKNWIEWGAFSDYFKLWKDEKGLYVFSKFTKENNTIYRRNMLKINEDTPVKVVSRRGWTVYKQGYVLNGIQLYTKHGNQGRLASVIDNTYILDWYGFVVDNRTLRVMDTYANKMYKYNSLTDNDLRHLPRVLFYNLYNNIPDDIYDVVWNKWSYWYFYWKDSEYINYELGNSKKGTEEDLKKIQQDLKNSIQILNKEDIDFYLWMKPEELWISSNTDLPKNNNENTGNTISKNATREEKKSCVAYYTYMRSMSSHSDWCLWEVNKDMSDSRLDYWWAISTDWDLSKFWVRDKTKYRRCWHWNNYKEGVKKTLWDKWPAFWKDRQTNYIATEAKDIDVNALCSHIVVWSQMNSWGLTFDNFSKAIEWTLLSRGDTVWTLNWISVPKNVFERDYALMMRYEIACKDKVRLPTEYDNTFSDLLLFKTFWDDNNKNVCKKAEELKEKFKEKYKDLIFTKNYEKAFKSDFGEDSVNSSWTVVIEKALSWSIDKALKVKSLSGLWEKTAWALVDYFTKDYTDWYNKGFSLLGWKGCGVWIWVKEWDYIMRLFLFMILIWLVWKS